MASILAHVSMAQSVITSMRARAFLASLALVAVMAALAAGMVAGPAAPAGASIAHAAQTTDAMITFQSTPSGLCSAAIAPC